ncbi:phosphoribosylglycinamide formyltransferase [Kineococcus sp. R8]|uniref:phosphoribosylglycinamide formyltransferase n=1 Tax=Kineococcus siccus TaxID=2696567 RepID=UPI001413350E|nr:phosphoribosylglycinamide formyltransferase [Kineococcus siccus]
MPPPEDPTDAPVRVVVLASGSGSTLQALLDARDPAFTVVAVGSDRPDAAALRRGSDAGAETFVVPPREHPDRAAWDRALADAVAVHRPGLVVLAGFMRIVGAPLLEAFGGRTLNTHPALLPCFPGAHGVADALAHGVRVTGCTVHLVDAGVDTGPILDQAAVRVRPDDDEASLHERIKAAERVLLVDVVARLAREQQRAAGRPDDRDSDDRDHDDRDHDDRDQPGTDPTHHRPEGTIRS